MSIFLHKLFITILSIVSFSAVAAGFQTVFSEVRELGFGLLFGIYSFYSAPVFLLGGIPAAYVADRFAAKRRMEGAAALQTYCRTFIIYGIAGATVAMLYSAIHAIVEGRYFFSAGESFAAVGVGLTGAVIYYHISLLLQIDWNDRQQQYKQEV
ncbi:hypothetical protein SAMN05421736_10147 [Evansella caseinilytica]|uniref:Uncharacterized protein n=1 Tax=Evansella caseinilytica TaxID=1503961 RepID=A0A1H3G285_9BACI|nr:hypothetical protein [Evansella caseinilytica]SDX97371.1 hypothetical protein SAMN05421736_10147 [Evansella caseinilytica]